MKLKNIIRGILKKVGLKIVRVCRNEWSDTAASYHLRESTTTATNFYGKQLSMLFETYDPFYPGCSDDFTFGRWFPQSVTFAKEILPFLQEIMSTYIRENQAVTEISIADVGGGIGAGSEYIRARMQIYFHKTENNNVIINMTCIDTNKSFKEWCNHFSPKIIFQHGNAFNMIEKYDYIISSHTIEHVEQPYMFGEYLAGLARKNVFIYAPYNEFPLPKETSGHINTIDDTLINKLNPLKVVHINSAGYGQKDCVLFVLPGKAGR